ncbi:MAG: CoA transferase [Candidatus Gracilibacteria bacterium]|nr:CoA transferase [Candidatus Gracilibacteria bacterium]
MENLFTGIKVLDCSRIFSGPFCTRYFADYGADVLKIETENFFDESRLFYPIKNGKSGYFEVLNRGKKSINLDIKTADGLALFYELIKEVDIFVENFSPSVKKRLKIDYETLSTINPRLIYGSVNGYGENWDKKAYDVIVQAESGIASFNGEDKPIKNATAMIDAFSGNSLALGIASLLYKREKTGNGDFVNVSMIACGFQLLKQNITATSISGKNPDFPGNQDTSIFPFGFYKTGDGNISIAIGNDVLWERFCENIIPDIAGKYSSNSLRMAASEHLVKNMEYQFDAYKTDDLVKKLEDLGIPCGKIASMTDLIANPKFFENKYLSKFNHPELGKIVVPYKFVDFKSYEIEPLKLAPDLEK